MTNRKKTSKRRALRRGLRNASSGSSDILPVGNPKPSLYGNQLASPPASSGLVVPSSPPEAEMHNPNRLLNRGRNEGNELSHGVSQPTADAGGNSTGTITSPSDSGLGPPSRPSRSQTRHRAALEPNTTGRSKHLSLREKVKLLRISCSNGVKFLHSPTFGKHAEEDVWTTIMEEFSTTVRAGFFTKYSQVKKMNNKICRNRRKRTEGTVAPERRSQMKDLDTWIDRWVRVWKCRDLVISIANAHQSIRETIGEKKLKRIFGHRMDGNELPPELGVLTFSAPLWKAIQKRIRTVERSLRKRQYSLFPGEDESDWMDEDEIEDDAVVEAIGEGPPLQSIEEEFQNGSFQGAQGNLTLARGREAETESLDLPAPSPRTQAMLDQFEHNCVSILKEEQHRTGKQISVLGLVQKNARHEPSPNPVPDNHNESQLEGNMIVAPEPQPPTSYLTSYFRKMEDEVEHNTNGSCVENPILQRTPCSEANTQRNVGPNSSGLQRLRPGTYSAGKPVCLGWHTSQLPLAGVNDTAEQDFRQSVFVTISPNGHFNIRLRSHNIQGEPVPSAFRLKGTISVSYKDVTYHPIFQGMSHNEMRLEVARQSLVPANQRPALCWVPTPVVDSNSGRGIRVESIPEKLGPGPLSGVDVAHSATDTTREAIETTVQGSKTAVAPTREIHPRGLTSEEEDQRRDEGETSSQVPLEAKKQGTSLPELHGRQSSEGSQLKAVDRRTALLGRKHNEGNSSRTGTPPLLRKFLADQDRKRQRPLAPKSIPYLSSPPRKPSAQIKRSNKNRITPSRFYGTQSLERNIGRRNQWSSGMQIQSSSQEPTIQPRPRYKAHQMAGPASNNHSTSGRKTSSKFYLPTTSGTSLQQDDSDNESFPEVEELHRRLVKANEHNNTPPTLQPNSDTHENPRKASTGVTHEEDRVRGTHSPTNHNAARTDTPRACHGEYEPPSLGRMSTDFRGVVDGESRRGQGDSASTPSRSQSRKRSRCHSTGNSQPGLACSLDASLLKPATVSESPEPFSSRNPSHPPKRQKHSQESESVLNTRLRSGFEDLNRRDLFSGSKGASTTPGNHVSREEPGTSNDGAVDKGKGKTAQLRFQDKHWEPDSGPSTKSGHGHFPNRRRGGKRRMLSSHRPSYEQPAGPSASATPWKRRQTGRGKRGRREELGRHNPRNSGNNRNEQSNRYLREETTDMADFENFSLDGKCDILRRQMSRMMEVLRNVKKQD